jgi:hypothetical protein
MKAGTSEFLSDRSYSIEASHREDGVIEVLKTIEININTDLRIVV